MLHELRVAFRALRKTPSFAAVAVITLALGLGAAGAVFTVVNAVLLRPLPYERPDELLWLREQRLPQFPSFSVAPGNYVAWRDGTRTLADVAAMSRAGVTLTGTGEPVRLLAERVSGNFFAMLGVQPVAGRLIGSDDDRPGAAQVVVLSEALWRGRFGGDPSIVGRTLALDGDAYVVSGVAPAAMTAVAGDTVQVWVPMAMEADEAALHGSHYMRVIARLAPGETVATAEADLDRIAVALEQDFPNSNDGWRVLVSPLQEFLVRNVSSALVLLSAAVGLVLLVVCANVASLLLARGLARQKELAVRAALGAERWRIVREQIVEGCALSALAAPLGLLVAWGLLRALAVLAPAALPQTARIELDAAAVLSIGGLAVVLPILFALLPALQLSRGDLRERLASGGRMVGHGLKARTRAALVVGQMALAIVLLVTCGLVLRSFTRLMQVDPGFEPARALSVGLQLSSQRYAEPSDRARFERRLLERLVATPGVSAAGLSQSLPLANDYVASLDFPDRPAVAVAERPTTNFYAVSPGFLDAMGMRLVRGRFIADTDTADAPRVVVINETFARRFYPGEDPLGRQVMVTQGPSDLREIVGVVADTRQYGLASDTTVQVYESYQQQVFGNVSVVVRSEMDPAALSSALRDAVRELDPDQPVGSVVTLDTMLAESVGTERFSLALFSAFAALGLALAAVGLYGLVAFSVRQRTVEIGVRVAMGARPMDVAGLVLRQALVLSLAGISIGLAASAGAARVVERLLFDTSPRDLATFTVVPLVLLAVVLLATLVPARRAARVDPTVALRGE